MGIHLKTYLFDRLTFESRVGCILLLWVFLCAWFCVLSSQGRAELLGDTTFFNHTSHYYIVQSDVSLRLAEEIGIYMDRMNHEYRETLGKIISESEDRLHVRIYKRERSYYELVGNKNSIGAFLPSKRLLCAYLGDRTRVRLLQLLRHEGLHQFMYAHVITSCPPWINEGLAECFEHGYDGRGGFRSERMPQKHVKLLRSAVRNNRLIPLECLLMMEAEEWNSNLGNRSLAFLQYAQAWSVVYYVMNENGGGNKDVPIKYLRAVQAGKRGKDALRCTFGEEFDRFRQGWLSYVEELTN